MIYFVDLNDHFSTSLFQFVDKTTGINLLEKICQSDYVALDLECNGMDQFTNEILLAAYSDGEDTVVFQNNTVGVDAYRYIINGKKFIGQNIKYDYTFLNHHYGVEFEEVHDTMLWEQVLLRGYGKTSDKPWGLSFSLVDVHKRHIGFVPEGMDKDIRKEFVGISLNTYRPSVAQIYYSANDVKYLHRIKESQEAKAEKYGLTWYLKSISNKLTVINGDSENEGFGFDLAGWKRNIANNKTESHKQATKLDELIKVYREQLPKKLKDCLTGGGFDKTRVIEPKVETTDLFGNPLTIKDFSTTKSKKIKLNPNMINWSSPARVVELCGILGFDLPTKDREQPYAQPRLETISTAKGPKLEIGNKHLSFTTGKDSLDSLLKENPEHNGKEFIETLLKYRKAEHAIKSFGENWFEKLSPQGKIHTVFRIETAETGRYQSGGGNIYKKKRPNLQNIIAENEYRHCFVAPEGYSYTTCDLSSAEAVIMCDKSNDETFYKFAIINDDAHSPLATASWRNIYLYRAGARLGLWDGVTEFVRRKNDQSFIEQIKKCSYPTVKENYALSQEYLVDKNNNKPVRTQFKACTFGIPYGAGDKTVARSLSVSQSEGGVVIWTVNQIIPKVMKYMDYCVHFAINNGYIQIDDRTNIRVYFPEAVDVLRGNKDKIEFSEFLRISGAARNYTIQGTQANMIKEAEVRLYNYIKENSLDCMRISQVHDELVYKQPLVYDGVSEQFKKNPKVVKYHLTGDIPKFITDPKIVGVRDNRPIIETTFPEVVKIIMTDTANLYLKHFTMNADYKVAPHWLK
jgi:DNA polymerase I-like protein with 3'-5' exonuclease and polymerase domains